MRVLRAVGRHEPVTTTELSAVLGGHENTTRQHLEALSRDGMVRGEQNRGRMGRPSVSYSVTPAGLMHLAGRVASLEHTALVATLADHLATTSEDPAADARRVGLAWGRRLAEGDQPRPDGADERDDTDRVGEGARLATDAGAPDSVGQALDLLEALGFSPVLTESTRPAPAEGRETALLLRTCPLLDAARVSPTVVCSVHEGLVEGFLRAGGTQADVVVEPFAERHGCRATITS